MKMHTLCWAVCGAALVWAGGCDWESETERRGAAEPAAAAAAGTLRLSSEMQAGAGLEIAAVATRDTRDALAATGWVDLPPGNEVVVKAPVTGFVFPGDGNLPQLGSAVALGAELAAVQVFLSPHDEAQLVAAKEDTDILMQQSLVSMRLAEAQLDRLKNAKDVVAGTRLAELQEIYERSKVAYNEARQKLPFLVAEPYEAHPRLKPVKVQAPLAGRVLTVHVRPGQFVLQGDPLWTIADWSRLWLRVPIFEGDLPRLEGEESAEAALPGTHQMASARRVPAPQPTRPGLRTVDLFYELHSGGDTLRPGQPLPVSIPLGTSAERIVIPRSAVLWDGFGNAWVYLRTGEATFRRQRVELGPPAGEGVVIERGLTPGDQLVTRGAATLHGEEFKGQLQAEDDD